MKENTVWILTYILLVAAFAYVIGWVSGGLFPPAENLLAFLAAGPLALGSRAFYEATCALAWKRRVDRRSRRAGVTVGSLPGLVAARTN
jgi:hypothetical protein